MKSRSYWFHLCGVIVVAGGCLSIHASSRDPTLITESEANFLVRLAPSIQRATAEGIEIKLGLDETPGVGFNVDSYWLYRVVATTDAPSGLIGHYGVNKHTADVWEYVLTKRIESRHIETVQAVLREIHRIGPETIAKYRDLPIYVDIEQPKPFPWPR